MLNLDNIYKYHFPKEGQNEKYEALREKGKELAIMIAEMVPAGREQDVAFTHVETAIMWANAGIARSSDLEPWQQRVVEEYDDLNKKREKLTDFFTSKEYQALPEYSKTALDKQYEAMRDYSVVLKERIDRFEVK